MRKLIVSPTWRDFLFSLSPYTLFGGEVVIITFKKRAELIYEDFLESGVVLGFYLDARHPTRLKLDTPADYPQFGVIAPLLKALLKRAELFSSATTIYLPSGLINPLAFLTTFFFFYIFLETLPAFQEIILYAERPYYDFLLEKVAYERLKGFKPFKTFWLNYPGLRSFKFPWGGGEYLTANQFQKGFELLDNEILQQFQRTVEGTRISTLTRKFGLDFELLHRLTRSEIDLLVELYNQEEVKQWLSSLF